MSRTSNQIIRPSGLRQSKDGNYIYASCNVTGKPTFFGHEYFVKVLERYNGDENKFFKEYVCKDVKNLRKLGKTEQEIKEILGTFDPKAPKPKKRLAEPVVEKVKSAPVVTEKVSTPVAVTQEKVVTKSQKPVTVAEPVVYPWSHDPQNYFLSGPSGPINWEEASRQVCFFPARNLDDNCLGCSIYDKCTCIGKIDDEKRIKLEKRGKDTPVVRKINLVAGCFGEQV